MDFKSFLRDKYSYDIAFIVVDQLSKQAISLPYFKTITIKIWPAYILTIFTRSIALLS